MCRPPRAHLGEAPAKAERFLDGDALAPGGEVPAYLVDATRLEAHGEGTVVVALRGLVKVEDECRGVSGRGGVEAEDDPGGFLLERPERALRIPLQVEFRGRTTFTSWADS